MTTKGTPFSPGISEADLHGVVDGRLEPGRQTEVLRRLRSHPADRAHIEAWREQNELIRATFSEVEHETLPVSLCLTPPTRLRCVVSEGQPVSAQVPSFLETARFTSDTKRKRARLWSASMVMVCAGIAGAWIMLPADTAGPSAVPASAASLAAETVDAMARAPLTIPNQPAAASSILSFRASTSGLGHDLPAVAIPDLAENGFSFTGASSQQAGIPALLLFYEDRNAQRIVIGVTNEALQDSASGPAPVQTGQAVMWRRHGKTFAMTGTIDQRRLNDIAVTIQAGYGKPD